MNDDCVFCKIVKGELPSYKLYEDDRFIAFLDIKPLTKGYFLVIPKKHYRWTYDVPDFGDFFEVAKKVGIAAQKAFDAEWICFLTLGFEVPHAHIRVIPRYKNDIHGTVVDTNKYESFTKDEMRAIANKIREYLKL